MKQSFPFLFFPNQGRDYGERSRLVFNAYNEKPWRETKGAKLTFERAIALNL